MYLKRWTVALLAMLALVACGSPAVDTVARVDNVVLSRKELDVRIGRLEQGFQKQPQQGAAPSRIDIEKRIVSLFVDQNLVLGLAKARGVSVSDKEIDKAVGQFRDSVAQSGAQAGATAPTLMRWCRISSALPGGDSTEFRQFASFFVARQKIAETLVTTDTVRQQVTDQVMAEASKPVHEGHGRAHPDQRAGRCRCGYRCGRAGEGQRYYRAAGQRREIRGSGQAVFGRPRLEG